MTGYLQREADIGGYEAANEAAPLLDGAVCDSLARLIGAARDEIALTENATVALADGLLRPGLPPPATAS